ncbi:DUF6404 family protein [Vibrio diabolicus]|uniref:DUF6404 family protein n=1 Tax=Vibrio diabolicus TaxID=50719 RepID=UPI0023B170E6|nr:DUF6404 family protein [Vibrio diabolicus]
MDYETKLQLAHKELSDKGVWKSNYNPPLVKLLRKLGLCFPPPYYRAFSQTLCFVWFSLLLFGESSNGFLCGTS